MRYGYRQFLLRSASSLSGPTLSALSLAAASIVENSAGGTVVGGVLGKTSGSTLTLIDSAGSRFALSGTNIVAGSVATDYEAATSHSITLRETLAGYANSPRDTVLTITVANVFEQPSLSALSLSSASFTVGTAASGAITGATAGSTITASGLPAGLTINGAARTWAYDGTGSAGTSTITLTETLADSANSPRASGVSVTIAAAPTLAWMPMETGNALLPNASSGTTAEQYTVHTVRGACSGLRAVLSGVQFSTTLGQIALPSYNVQLAVEYPKGSGTFLTKATGTVPSGGWLTLDIPCPASWSDGDQFGLWVYASAAGSTLPRWATGSGAANTDLYTDENCTFSTAGTTPRSTITDDFQRRRRFAGVVQLLAQRTATATSIAVVGDSQTAYATSALVANSATSDYVRGDVIRTISQDYPCTNLGIGDNQWPSFLYGSGGLSLLKYLIGNATVAIDAMGVNTYNNLAMSSTDAIGYDDRARPLFNGKRFLKGTISPRTTGTFADEAGQTAATYSSSIDTQNTAIRAYSGDRGFVERRTPVQGTDPSKWAGGFVLDGIHHTLAGQSAVIATRAAMKAAVDARTTPLAAAQPSLTLTSASPVHVAGWLTSGGYSQTGTLPYTGDMTIEFWTSATGAWTSMRLGMFGSLGITSATSGTGRLNHFSGNGSGTQTAGTAIINDGLDHHVRLTRSVSDNRVRVYVDGVLDITGAVSNLGQASALFSVTMGTGQRLRQIAAYSGLLNAGNFTPPSPGYITDPANTAGLIAYWSLATDGTGAFGPVLPQ